MTTVKPDELRYLAELLEAKNIPGAVMVTQAAFEIERLEASNEELIRGMTEMAERFTAAMDAAAPKNNNV